MAHEGIDIRESGTRLLLWERLLDSNAAEVTTGDTLLALYELQADGTLKSYDWDDNTFKTTALATETAAMAHCAGNNATTDTGLWTYALTTLTGLTPGALYIQAVSNTSAVPVKQMRIFQYGGKFRLGPHSKSTQVVSTGVVAWFDEDGATTLATMTPTEATGTITVTPS